ncbi:MAG: hypothetical protein HY812_03075 [Planctomycetes bacterium]|nr:hypothetical protein [Planctomycetota bacterium]
MSTRFTLLLARSLVLASAAAALCACASTDLWPLYERDKDSLTVAYPLYVREGPFRLVFPFYCRTNEGRDHHVLWPLVKVSEGRLVRAAPFYYSAQEDRFTLLPLIHQTPERTILGVPPAYIEGDFQLVLPFYLRTGGHRVVLPGVYWRTNGGEVDRVVCPLVVYAREGNARKLYVLSAGAAWGGKSHRQWFLPLFSRSEAADARKLWLAPYLRVESQQESTTALYPFFERSEVRQGTTRTANLTVLWPIYERNESFDARGDVIDLRRRFLIFGDRLDQSGMRTLSVLGLPIVERTRA